MCWPGSDSVSPNSNDKRGCGEDACLGASGWQMRVGSGGVAGLRTGPAPVGVPPVPVVRPGRFEPIIVPAGHRVLLGPGRARPSRDGRGLGRWVPRNARPGSDQRRQPPRSRLFLPLTPPPRSADFCLVAVEGDDPPQGEIWHLGPTADPERPPGQGDHLGDALLKDQTEHGRTCYTGSQGVSNATAAAVSAAKGRDSSLGGVSLARLGLGSRA